MYKMTRYEFVLYKTAKRRLNQLKKQHKKELQRAYAYIHPTRTAFDYNLGRIYSETLNPEEYAVYLVDMQIEHERIEKYWAIRAEVFEEVTKDLSEKELHDLYYRFNSEVEKKVKKELERIISMRPDLRRSQSIINEIQAVEEYDKQIESMSEEELLDDYIDFLEDESLEEKCLYLRDVHEMTFSKIAEQLCVTTSRVSEIIKQHESKRNTRSYSNVMG